MQENHKRFADRYFETLNAKESAEYAGFSVDTAKQQGWQLLQREDVQERLSLLKADYSEKSGVSIARVIDEYRKIAFSDIRSVLTIDGGLRSIDDLDDDTAAAISGIESFDEFTREGEKLGTNRKIKMHDKLRALEALGKHLGVFEKDNNQKNTETPIQVTIIRPNDVD